MSTTHDATRTRVIPDVNPADTADVLAEVTLGTAADVERAVERAERAFPA